MKPRFPLAALAAALLAAAPLAAQVTPPPRDTLRIPAAPEAEAGVEADTARPSRWGTPFAVEATGGVTEPRPARVPLVWVAPEPPRRDTTTPPPPPDSAVAVAVPPRTPARPDSARRAPRPGATPAPATGRAAARPRTHTVAPGETFYGIARRYSVTSAALRAANPDARWESLRTGDVLRIPAAARAGSTTPSSGSRAGAASRRRTHTVARGETLYGIARRYDVSVARLREANNLRSDGVRTGQTLVIPAAN